jgi:hypothetical protein
VRLGKRGRRRRAERLTLGLGTLAVSSFGALVAVEYGRVWNRGSAPLPTETDRVLEAASEAAVETVEVVAEGYRSGTTRENALLNMTLSFSGTFAVARASTHLIRRRGNFGPFRNYEIGESHIHHFVPGILLAFIAGGASVLSRNEALDPWLAVPFGAGVALTFDESALLLKLDDVYWTEEGVVSVQISLAALALASAIGAGRRMLRRGEAQVLPDAQGSLF